MMTSKFMGECIMYKAPPGYLNYLKAVILGMRYKVGSIILPTYALGQIRLETTDDSVAPF